MPILRKVVTSGVAVVAALAMVTGTGSAAPADELDHQLPACNVKNFPNQVWKTVWTDAPAYYLLGNGKKEKKGTLTKGNRYVYCQKNWGKDYRQSVTDGTGRTYTNTWWALTNIPNVRNVWVNVIYLKGGNNDQPEPGVPQGS
ncbi:hypothetical protein AB0I60_01850 [Actinosynnema sp. NPDC050436]|uniref:hypothetical protein n=1 Tax=Actinosynnema sp. NPDC050436 TaxID=3155659 RepID=UPI0033EEE285